MTSFRDTILRVPRRHLFLEENVISELHGLSYLEVSMMVFRLLVPLSLTSRGFAPKRGMTSPVAYAQEKTIASSPLVNNFTVKSRRSIELKTRIFDYQFTTAAISILLLLVDVSTENATIAKLPPCRHGLTTIKPIKYLSC